MNYLHTIAGQALDQDEAEGLRVDAMSGEQMRMALDSTVRGQLFLDRHLETLRHEESRDADELRLILSERLQ